MASVGSTPGWVYGYVPTAEEWNSWWSKKLDTTDTVLIGGPFLPIAGGGLSGPLTLSRDPVSGLEAATRQYVDTKVSVGSPSNTNPLMNGPVASGSNNNWARTDHVHPVDTSRYAASNPNGYQTAAQVTSSLGPYALVASPTFTGDPKAPTPVSTDNDTSIATTAFVQNAISGVVLATPGIAGNTGRNYLHNSLFNIQERGFGPWVNISGYHFDRWGMTLSADSATVSRRVLGDADRAGIGEQEAMNAMTCAYTGNSSAPLASYTINNQAIENIRRLAGKTVVVSFYAVADGVRKFGISFDQYFGSGGSPSAVVNGTGQSVTLSTTWTRYTLTFNIASVSGKIIGTNNDHQTVMQMWYSAGSNYNTLSGTVGIQTGTVSLWGIQVEIGSVATPLERPDQMIDLMKCQRFYAVVGMFTQLTASGAGTIGTSTNFPVPMRAVPTVAISSTGGSVNISGPTASTIGNKAAVVVANVSAAGTVLLSAVVTASADF